MKKQTQKQAAIQTALHSMKGGRKSPNAAGVFDRPSYNINLRKWVDLDQRTIQLKMDQSANGILQEMEQSEPESSPASLKKIKRSEPMNSSAQDNPFVKGILKQTII